jgi:hypothetical protein
MSEPIDALVAQVEKHTREAARLREHARLDLRNADREEGAAIALRDAVMMLRNGDNATEAAPTTVEKD